MNQMAQEHELKKAAGGMVSTLQTTSISLSPNPAPLPAQFAGKAPSAEELTKQYRGAIEFSLTQPNLVNMNLPKREWLIEDMLYEAQLLPWIDLSAGRGKRPMVRFRLEDIEQYEEKLRQQPGEIQETTRGAELG